MDTRKGIGSDEPIANVAIIYLITRIGIWLDSVFRTAMSRVTMHTTSGGMFHAGQQTKIAF